MMNKLNSICFAFAVSNAEVFEAKHFGDADNYLIYRWKGGRMHEEQSLINPLKDFDESHGAAAKGEAIAAFLLSHKVHVLVSKRFGKNVQVVNKHFLPVIIDGSSKAACFEILEQYMNALTEALMAGAESYPVFAIRDGALKRISVRDEN